MNVEIIKNPRDARASNLMCPDCWNPSKGGECDSCKLFLCAWCEEWVSWEEGCAGEDEVENTICDTCWCRRNGLIQAEADAMATEHEQHLSNLKVLRRLVTQCVSGDSTVDGTQVGADFLSELIESLNYIIDLNNDSGAARRSPRERAHELVNRMQHSLKRPPIWDRTIPLEIMSTEELHTLAEALASKLWGHSRVIAEPRLNNDRMMDSGVGRPGLVGRRAPTEGTDTALGFNLSLWQGLSIRKPGQEPDRITYILMVGALEALLRYTNRTNYPEPPR